MPALAIRTRDDGLLGAVAPLGLAVAAPGPTIVVDLDPEGPRYPGRGSLAAMTAEGGPRRSDLEPRDTPLAVLRNGGVDAALGAPVAKAFASSWPYAVVRLPARSSRDVPWPIIELVPLLPGGLFDPPGPSAVFQDCGWGVRAPGRGLTLPKPRPGVVRALIAGTRHAPDRWIRAWRRVWNVIWAL